MTISENELPVWPEEGVRRIPYAVYSSEAVFQHEQTAIFRGPIWHFLGLEAQLPEAGSYMLAQVGEVSVIVVRRADDTISALVNRCSHKGTPLAYTPTGKTRIFRCIYHNWCYDHDGKLTSVAFEHGVNGKGGMASSFDKVDNGLDRLRVHVINGLIFGTLNDATPPFEEYVGPELVKNIQRVCGKPIRVLGRYSQILPSNWKLYIENVKDPYHASILHAFNGVMKQDRLTMEGGIVMGTHGWSQVTYSKMLTDNGDAVYASGDLRSAEISEYGFGLRDKSLTAAWDDHGDGVSMTIQTVFPNFVLQQLRNCLAVRTIVPRTAHESELRWVAFGYQDDDEQKLNGRLKQSNMMGPAGLIAMEDGMIGGLVHRGIAGSLDKSAVIEMGGHGTDPIPGSRVSEGSVRGFWTGYKTLMGL